MDNYFEDPSLTFEKSIEKGIHDAELINYVTPSEAIKSVIGELYKIKRLYPLAFKQLVLSQAVEDGKLKAGQMALYFGEKIYKITCEIIEEPVSIKKKWYQFK